MQCVWDAACVVCSYVVTCVTLNPPPPPMCSCVSSVCLYMSMVSQCLLVLSIVYNVVEPGVVEGWFA